MPNMYGDDPMDGNTINGPLGQGSHADAMRRMNPRLLDALINMRVEEGQKIPPMHQNPMGGMNPTGPPSEYDSPPPRTRMFDRGDITPPDAMGQMDPERQKRMMANPKDYPGKGDTGEPYGGQGEGPMREMSPKNYEQKRSEEKRRTAGGDRKGKSPDMENPAKPPKLGQGLIDRARKNTHTMPGSSKFKKPSDKKDSKNEE